MQGWLVEGSMAHDACLLSAPVVAVCRKLFAPLKAGRWLAFAGRAPGTCLPVCRLCKQDNVVMSGKLKERCKVPVLSRSFPDRHVRLSQWSLY